MIIVGNQFIAKFANNNNNNLSEVDMSNLKNNNLPVQSVTPSSSIITSMDTNSANMNTAKSPRPSGHDSSSSSSSFQRRRRTGGRSGAAAAGGHRLRPSGHNVQDSRNRSLAQCENHQSFHTTSDQNVVANDDATATTTTATSTTPSSIDTTNNNRGQRRGAHARSTGSGKYRQRQNTSQLIDGMESLTGLDVDLAESIVPTSSSTSRDLDTTTNRRRHATNSRKVNLTHLLNYKYERPRSKSRSNEYGGHTVSQRNSTSHYRDAGTAHKFNKQQFLQANCQFVVADGHDYTIHKIDPDWPVDWNCIEEVRFMQSAGSETTCPICLEPPIAAKITRCGHIYCWTCMLHYLSLSDEKSRQCPICFEHVYKSDLRSVISHSFTNYSVDEEINMRLMIRKKGCVEAEPYIRCENSIVSPSESHNSPHDSVDGHYWSRASLVIVDPRTVVSKIAQRERNELEFKLGADRDQPEVCFVEQALGMLEERINRLLTGNPELVTSKPKVKNSQAANQLESNNHATGSDPYKSYLFYQCIDGQHVYLNPFSTKILCHEYGSLENCPHELRAKILQMDWISMNDAWRKRFRYLSHLPLTCEFRLIEIDFERSNLVSSTTYKNFEDQIKWREQEREKRRREERKRDKKIQVQQDRKIYGIQPSLKINLDSIDQFPTVSDERYLGLSQPRNRSRVDQDDSYSSGEEIDLIRATVESTNAENIEQPTPTETIDELPEEIITNVATSFRDIQLQEAALEAKQKINKAPTTQSVWGSNKSGSSSANQSSFAQLLVDAKSSQKQWTRSATSSKNAQPGHNSTASAASSSQHRQRLISGSDEGCEEELRAPPFECTISDFIDMNIVSMASAIFIVIIFLLSLLTSIQPTSSVQATIQASANRRYKNARFMGADVTIDHFQDLLSSGASKTSSRYNTRPYTSISSQSRQLPFQSPTSTLPPLRSRSQFVRSAAPVRGGVLESLPLPQAQQAAPVATTTTNSISSKCALILQRTYVKKVTTTSENDYEINSNQDETSNLSEQLMPTGKRERVCITYNDVNEAISLAKQNRRFRSVPQNELNSIEPSAPVIAELGELNQEVTKILAEKFDLSVDEILNGLPLIDMSRTDFWPICPLMVKPVICDPSGRFRSFTGHCNNLNNPAWGAANTPFVRYLAPKHPDGIHKDRVSVVDGSPLPSPRLVTSIVHRDHDQPSGDLSLLIMVWGQIIDHDVAQAAPPRDERGMDFNCCERKHPNCKPIQIPDNDPLYSRFNQKCMDFKRSLAGLRPNCALGPRVHQNTITATMDANTVYGSTKAVADQLRTFSAGLLKEQDVFRDRGLKPLLPQQLIKPDLDCFARPKDTYCFLAGDDRVNEQPTLTVIHTLYQRDHNRLAREMAKINPHWDDDRIYHETRHIEAAIVQNILVNEYLPLLLGRQMMDLFNLTATPVGQYYTGYDPNITPSISQGFTTAAFRQGHTFIQGRVQFFDSKTHRYLGNELLRNLFKRPFHYYAPGRMDQVIAGIVNTPAQSYDPFITEEIAGHLFQEPGLQYGMDLPAINLARGREQGVPGYNVYRELCGLPRAETFEDLQPHMSNMTAHHYSRLYRHVDDIDLWSGGVSERRMPGAQIGPTFACIIGRQFANIKRGDRFWYENAGFPSSFTLDQLREIKKTTQARVICKNSDSLHMIQRNALKLPHPIYNPRVRCSDIPDVDLSYWRENPASPGTFYTSEAGNESR